MPPSRSRKRAERDGHLGEVFAAIWLMAKGYRIAARRYKSPVGEIDLIARRNRALVFVEVKTRRRAEDFGSALLSVNRRRIVRAAEHFLAHHPHLSQRDMRFDVIFLAPLAWPRHVRNAFEKE